MQIIALGISPQGNGGARGIDRVQFVLNHSVRPYLGNRAPVTVLTGRPADNSLSALVRLVVEHAHSLKLMKAQRLMEIDSIMKAVEAMRKGASEKLTRKREEAVKSHNRMTGVQTVNFDIGDSVLVAKRTFKGVEELRVNWIGPRRVIRVASHSTFEIQNQLTNAKHVVHVSRLKLYSDSHLNISEQLLDSIAHNVAHLNREEPLLRLRQSPQSESCGVIMNWNDFENEKPTSEPFSNVQEEVSAIPENFLQDYSDQDLVKAARDSGI